MEQKPLKYSCKEVGNDFFIKARVKFQNTAILPVSSEIAFKILEDGDAWPIWYRGIHEVDWKTPKPFGVGTTRIAKLEICELYEYFFNWEKNKRISFYVLSHNSIGLKLFNALAEDYKLEDLPDGKCCFTYTVAIELSWFLWTLWPIAYYSFASLFRRASENLPRYCAEKFKASEVS